MIGLGFAWASIISLPYAMLANNLPSRKMGVNIGIFNIFIVIPQLLAVSVLAMLLDVFADGDPSYALVIAAVGWFLAGLAVLRLKESASPARARGSAPPARRLAPVPLRSGLSRSRGVSR